MTNQTSGLCKFCGTEHNKSIMVRHIKSCKTRKTAQAGESPVETYITLQIVSAQESAYWIIVEMSVNGLLQDLDRFLRRLWFDAGDHLSVFNINKIDFVASPIGPVNGERSQVIKLSRALGNETKFTYAFDFASPGICQIRVVNIRKGKKVKNPKEIVILSRNIPPEYLCIDCGKPADHIHTDSLWRSSPEFICNSCLHKRFLEENDYDIEGIDYIEGYDPIHNSPRMLQEGYLELYIPDVFVPDITST